MGNLWGLRIVEISLLCSFDTQQYIPLYSIKDLNSNKGSWRCLELDDADLKATLISQYIISKLSNISLGDY